MDLRIVKTRHAVKEAFMTLRAQKAVEKISVKELCQLARINKSTFYSHYEDLFSLSSELEKETVDHILGSIATDQEYSIGNPEEFAREICMACINHLSLTDLLFAGQENGRLANRLEEGIKELIYQKYPEYRDDARKNVLLSFCIQGAHHAYLNNQGMDVEVLVNTIERIIKLLQPLFR